MYKGQETTGKISRVTWVEFFPANGIFSVRNVNTLPLLNFGSYSRNWKNSMLEIGYFLL
jgi:hypothetical protein